MKLKYYLPDISIQVLGENITINKTYSRDYIKEVLDNSKDIMVLLDKKSISIFESTITLLEKSVKEMDRMNINEICYVRDVIHLGLSKKRYFPLVGVFDNPYLLILNKIDLSENDYFELSQKRISKNFTIIDANEFSRFLFA